ncbi:ASCC2 family CUE domain-containing protein [Aspergillus vadensis CBS 113365]|uniref:CUE domain protein n=1 Tax=Aspergillus vadensis (strain CBS 113365 / IMI 142717 / IBT 24658) TaxID=1448311 RepID=A0A319B9W0_ASPVC|nr:CUE domain protein [Aspergillus vadensis CBS 113365]PYH69159.1 CUE domain protein [Aspergillus vadensis CBS 113365]
MPEPLPPLAPVPPPEVQSTVPPNEWELYIDAWILLLQVRIEAPDSQFKEIAAHDETAVTFLTSFYYQSATYGSSGFHAGLKARSLRKLCFLLTRRFLLDASATPSELLDVQVLANMCCTYPSSAALKRLLSDAWNKHQDTITSSLEKAKTKIIRELASLNPTKSTAILSDIRLLTILASALPGCGQVLMTGSDFLDTFADAYQTHKRADIRSVLVANVYVGLASLLKGPKLNLSALLDQLYSLKSSAGVGSSTTKKEPTLLSDVICSTDLLVRLDRHLITHPQKRGQDLLTSLRTYQEETKVFHRRHQKQKKRLLDKGKGRAATDLPAPEDMHIHRMSLITQVQDLFPDLGSGYITRLLDHYNDDPETIVSHLLDDSIPSELRTLDKSEQLPTSTSTSTIPHDPLPPRSTPPPTAPTLPARRNIFDNDVDLAELSDQSTLHHGRRTNTTQADDLLADRTHHSANKAAILSALATFDSDDDERDDTYDIADVGGTIDDTTTDDAKAAAEQQQEAELSLYRTYKSNPALFARDSATRRSQPRASLKRETGMTDEAIEGWAVMLSRDPKRLAKLEDKMAFGAADGGGLNQPELPATSYRRPGAGTEDDDESEAGGSSSSRGRGGRGRGGRGRGRGAGQQGSTPGNSNPAVARQRKEENKASRANHNRRQQRARKVARAGGMMG